MDIGKPTTSTNTTDADGSGELGGARGEEVARDALASLATLLAGAAAREALRGLTPEAQASPGPEGGDLEARAAPRDPTTASATRDVVQETAESSGVVL